jgi:4'-phosphopantetheinyl transferase
MPLPLPPAEAHLYYLPTYDRPELVTPSQLALYRSWMTPEECARCDRYVFEHSRHEYTLTRALIRSALSLYADVEPTAWRFSTGSHGKPAIAGPRGHEHIRFNLSNTRGLIALLIVRDHEVGVDVEDIDRKSQTVEVAERYFSPLEVDALWALPESERRARFFEYWTLKEAYIKARGLGLSLPLEQFSFVLDPRDRPIGIRFDPRLGDDPARWQFAQLELTPRHACAAAIALPSAQPVRFVIRELLPAQRSSLVEPESGRGSGPGRISRR